MDDREKAYSDWIAEKKLGSLKDAFYAGWRSALDAVRKDQEQMVTLETLMRERIAQKEGE